MCRSNGETGRVSLESEHKLRIREDPPQAHLDASIERSTIVASFLIEACKQRQIGLCDRPPKRAMGEVSQDLSCAGRLFTDIRGFADENSGAARCVSRPNDVVGSENFDSR